MKILFISISRIQSIETKGIYTDLLRKFKEDGHELFILSPNERKYNDKTNFYYKDHVAYLNVWTTNIQKTNLFEKVLSTFLIEYFMYFSVKKYINYKELDLIIYSTPPITLTFLINKLKKASNAYTYLLLKDIFPQNAVDIGLIKRGSLIYKYYRTIEKRFYKLSDFIGCMSNANKDYVLKNNNYLIKNTVEINPNSIDLNWLTSKEFDSIEFREKWNIPKNALICLYGGNLGKPQGIDFLIKIINNYLNDNRIFFFIIGDGTEFSRLKVWVNNFKPKNILLLKLLPQKEYDEIAHFADAGLILLDPRFTIPNFPSRLLSYMENKLSIWAATDNATDLKNLILENNIGFWCNSGHIKDLIIEVEKELINFSLNKIRGELSKNYLIKNFNVNKSYLTIIKHFK